MPDVTDYRAKSYWLEQSGTNYTESPALEGLVRADALVVGGGFTGLSAAIHLKQTEPGMRVVLLESDVVGFGASGRNAGLVTAHFGMSLGAMLSLHGKANTQEAQHYGERAFRHLAELIKQHHIECEYESTGYLRVATTPAQAQRIRKECELAGSLGIGGIEWLDAQAVRALVNSPAYLGAGGQDRCALVNPAKLARGLKQVALDHGVEMYEHTPVTHLELSPRARAKTPRGAVEAEKVALATNAFSSQFQLLRPKQAPVHTYIVLTEPLSPAQLNALRWQGRQGVEDARRLPHGYRLTHDNRLLVAGGDARYFYGNQLGVDHHAPTFERLERLISQTFPALQGVRITHRWGGPISVTLGLAPMLGTLGAERRAVYSAGCMGHGVALSHLNGCAIGDLILEQRTELTSMFFVKRDTIPLPPEPLRAPLVNGFLAALRALDAFDERHGLGVRRQ